MSRPIFNVKPDVRPSPHRSHRHQLRAASGSPKAAPSSTRASHLGPLTTAFAQPSQCTRAILACPTCDTAWKGLSCNANWANGQQIVAPEDNTSCFPSATAYPKRPRSAFEGLGFYSPGTICPTGYTQACKAVSTKAGQTAPSIATPGPMTKGALQFPLVAGETAIGCCPTGYTCAQYPGHAWQTCHQVATSTKMDAATCSMDGQGPIKGFAVPFTTDGKTITKINVFAPLIQINHQATDVPDDDVNIAEATSIPSSSSSTSSFQSSSIPSSASATPTSTDAANAGAAVPMPLAVARKGLPLGAIAGIAVAGVVLFICLVGILIYLWLRKRHKMMPNRFGPNGAVKAGGGGNRALPGPSMASTVESNRRSVNAGKFNEKSAAAVSVAALASPKSPKESGGIGGNGHQLNTLVSPVANAHPQSKAKDPYALPDEESDDDEHYIPFPIPSSHLANSPANSPSIAPSPYVDNRSSLPRRSNYGHIDDNNSLPRRSNYGPGSGMPSSPMHEQFAHLPVDYQDALDDDSILTSQTGFSPLRPRFANSLHLEEGGPGVESPIDGTSPFRLKRGNTLKRNGGGAEGGLRSGTGSLKSLKRVASGKGRIVRPEPSPLKAEMPRDDRPGSIAHMAGLGIARGRGRDSTMSEDTLVERARTRSYSRPATRDDDQAGLMTGAAQGGMSGLGAGLAGGRPRAGTDASDGSSRRGIAI